MRKILKFIFMIVLITGCSNTKLKNKEYAKIVDKGYKKTNFDKKILANKKYENDIYYKYKMERKYKKEGVYFIVNENTKYMELQLMVGINNRSRNWVYMNRIIFANQKTKEQIEYNFDIENVEESYWKDGMTLTGGVYEKSVFTIETDTVDKLMDILSGNEIKITLLSDYDERSVSRKLSQDELKYMREMYGFWKEKQKEVDEKFEKEKLKHRQDKKDANESAKDDSKPNGEIKLQEKDEVEIISDKEEISDTNDIENESAREISKEELEGLRQMENREFDGEAEESSEEIPLENNME